jgi:hypothetical protein
MTQQVKETLPEPIRNGLGGTILGPRNVPLEPVRANGAERESR